jgi:hypothetical protein
LDRLSGVVDGIAVPFAVGLSKTNQKQSSECALSVITVDEQVGLWDVINF